MSALETLDKTLLVQTIKKNRNLDKNDVVWIHAMEDMEDGTVEVDYEINNLPHILSEVIQLPTTRREKHADEYEDTEIHTPTHYHSGGIDVIGFAEKQFSKEQLIGSHRINVLKYVTRFDKKGEPLKDLKKARVYLDKLIEIVEGEH